MSTDNSGRGNMFIFVRTSDSEMQKKVDEAEKTTKSAINVINFQSAQYKQIEEKCKQIKTDNDRLTVLNSLLNINNSQLARQNHQLATENEKLKNEYKIRQNKLRENIYVSGNQFSIFGAIDQIKQSTEKEGIPKCETGNDNKNLDKNN